jgi:hypothetical protein
MTRSTTRSHENSGAVCGRLHGGSGAVTTVGEPGATRASVYDACAPAQGL